MKNKIITIPNILSLFRLCLIPVIVWLYCFRQDYLLTTVVLIISGVTDVIDGIIARKFNMVSDFGKAFDPLADKLTQMAVLFCLVSRFSYMLIPLVILVIKELFAAVTGILAIKKTNTVMGAVWHGKLTTVLLYTVMLIHIIWFSIPETVSVVLVCICTVMMLISAVLYGMRNIKVLRG